jgi:uncharacterized membrane protein YuzA (DUF378 family)
MKYADPPVNKKVVNILFALVGIAGVWVVIGALH